MTNRKLELIVALFFGFLLTVMAFLMPAKLQGDGLYYFSMLIGLSTDASPSLSEKTRGLVKEYCNFDPISGNEKIRAKDGKIYGVHFWAYSLLCVPFYKMLNLLGFDVLKAFQLTNAVLVFFFIGVCFSIITFK